MLQGASAPGPIGGTGGVGVPRPRRSGLAVVIPAAVAVAMAGLLAFSAKDALRPVRDVQVVQAVHVLAADPPEPRTRDVAPAGGQAAASQPVLQGRAAQAAGWVEAEPYAVAAAGLAEGVIREVLVLEGDRVEVGQALARLVSDDAALALRAAEADAQVAVSAHAATQAEFDAAQTEWDEPVDRDLAVALAAAAVARAQAELVQWPAMVEAERARLAEIGQRLERARLARAAGGANEIEVLTLEREVDAQAATLRAMEAREGILAAELARAEGESRAAERGAALRVKERRELESTRAALAEAQASLRLAEVRRDEAALRLARMEIVAPISGVVQRLHATPGKRIMLLSDDPVASIVATLYDPSRLQVRVDVPLADAGGIVIGQACEVTVEVLQGVTLRGVVIRIGHEADIQKNTLEVKVRLIEPPGVLRPEMLARVKLLAGAVNQAAGGAGGAASSDRADRTSEVERASAEVADMTGEGAVVLIPAEAVEREGGTARVWSVRDRRGVRGVVRAEAVEVMGQRDGLVLIRGNVRAGDVLVASPQSLRDGMAVRIQAEPAQAAAAQSGDQEARP